VRTLAAKLASAGVCVVSGGAMGVDALAHEGAGTSDTIAVLPCGIDLRYPVINRSLLDAIGEKGLLLSFFEPGFRARPWSFVVRNEMVVALADAVVVAQADLESGSMRSAAFAKAMGRPLYVLPHRLGESEGTQRLLAAKEAEAIYDLEGFVARFAPVVRKEEVHDPLLDFCEGGAPYEVVASRFKEALFEAELEGRVVVKEGRVYPARNQRA
jgi:DNA processing protein